MEEKPVDEISFMKIKDLEKKLRVTEKKLAEMRASEKQYRLLIENAFDAIFIMQDGVVIFSNPKTKNIGKSISIDLSTTPFTKFIHREDKAQLADIINDEYKEEQFNQAYTFRLTNLKKNALWVEMFKIPIQWNEKPASIYFMRDISILKKREDQSQFSKKMEAIGTLAGGVAHNFNNLLQVIQGNISYIMLDKDFCSPYMDEIVNIERSVKSGSDLTKQLLSFARGSDYCLKPSNMNDIVENTAHMFDHTCKDIKIHKYLQRNIWTVEVDVGQIELVLINFYINSRHAMVEGGDLYLHTENVVLNKSDIVDHEKREGKYVKVSITDTGTGMDENVSNKIFDPFFTTKKEGTGTGLGLSTAYGVIKQHGGFISFDTEKGKGTAFHVYLPASDKAIIPMKAAYENLEFGTGTILLVDDEHTVITVGKLLIEEMGYDVMTAHGGRHALEKFKENKDKIDMVILDIIMPDMDGGKVYDQMKEFRPEIKVLLSSGYSKDGHAESILARGCNGFIQKPFRMEHLSSEIKKILNVP